MNKISNIIKIDVNYDSNIILGGEH